jgi:hypothetical protein
MVWFRRPVNAIVRPLLMSFELRIERSGGIQMEEWKTALSLIPGVRLDSNDTHATNPTTGELVTVPGHDGDAAVLVDRKWIKVFRYDNYAIRFRLGPALLDKAKILPVLQAAFAAARLLDATILDEDGNELRSWA